MSLLSPAERARQTPILAFAGPYRFLSNYHDSPILGEDGHLYPTAEHLYQASKTHDPLERARIRTAVSPGRAKTLGKYLPLRPDWEEVKLLVMEDVLRRKFAIPALRAQLLATGDRELVEGNWWGDTYWGMCNGVGENWLGKLLMAHRGVMRDAGTGVLQRT